VLKGDSVTLTCEVYPENATDSEYLLGDYDDDYQEEFNPALGRPAAVEYVWRRGGHVVPGVTTANWTIDPVTVEAEANISCVPVNAVGAGREDFVAIDVLGEPRVGRGRGRGGLADFLLLLLAAAISLRTFLLSGAKKYGGWPRSRAISCARVAKEKGGRRGRP